MAGEKTQKPNILEILLQLLPALMKRLPEYGQTRLEAILGLIIELVESLKDNELTIWQMHVKENDNEIKTDHWIKRKWDRVDHHVEEIIDKDDWIPAIGKVAYQGIPSTIGRDNGSSRSLLRVVYPAREPDNEYFLILDIKQNFGNERVSYAAAILNAIIQTFFQALRVANLFDSYELLEKLIQGGASDEEISNASQNILYLKLRLNQLKNPTNEDIKIKSPEQLLEWWEHPDYSAHLDAADDWVATVLIQSLISTATKPDQSSIKSLWYLFEVLITDYTKGKDIKKIVLCPERGPRLLLTPANFQSWNAVAEALARLATISFKNPPEYYQGKNINADLLVLAQKIHGKCIPKDNESTLWNIASGLTILSARAKQTYGAFDHQKISQLIKDAVECANECLPYLNHFLRTKGERNTELSSNWLEAWLGCQLIRCAILGNGNDIVGYLSMERVAELVYDWATYFRYLLTFCKTKNGDDQNQNHPDYSKWLHGGPDPEEVDAAKLELLCEWAHAQGVPRLIPLQKWLQTTYTSELALYSLSGKVSHRQHLFHVQDACLLGCALLDGLSGDKPLGEILSNYAHVKPEKLLQNWLVASLLHDIGYVLQVIPRGIDALGKETSDALAPLLDDIRKKLKQAPQEMGIGDPTAGRSISRLDIENHAYVSVLTVLRALAPLLDEGRIANDYNMALAAIVEHDVKDSCIDFQKDPLSGLMVICDELQDWGRPRLNAEMLSKRFMSAIRRVQEKNLPSISLQSINLSSKLFVSASWMDDRLVFESPGILEFVLKAHTAGKDGYEPAVAWLDICRAFQRIQSQEKSLTFTITLEHKLADDDIPELKRLHAFARKDPSSRGGILDWVEIVGKKNLDALQYCCDTTRKIETITFKVPQLGCNKPLVSIPAGLYRDFSEFTRRA